MPKKPKPKKKRKIRVYDNGFGFDTGNIKFLMTTFRRIACLKPQTNPNANRITVTWVGPDDIERTYTVNQRTLNRFADTVEAKAALDDWTSKSFGYVLTDIWFHKNRNATWAIATGAIPPDVWPEDEPVQ